ncbi:tRNA (pseudouridine(54)-N(1))-methyltransferase TrmY [Candidatus Heimdallarchaeota archaeon]|nr:MAG: tRNA (pseudouridine(54)-N(1))-methyltransferase TrmY [Candidatus Gerdarchaeota archaeon]RLI71182.1 MAG: tRNA (pseudouridine(54)-N(1))-methyltransferase TrmY [Candidatus Heimdallarchaeota archaeon]
MSCVMVNITLVYSFFSKKFLCEKKARPPMYEFILYSRKGHTSGNFSTLSSAGRLDTVYQCILTALFKSYGYRRDVIFHAILEGPPNPPLHLQVDGRKLERTTVDEVTWTRVLNLVLKGQKYLGISIEKKSFEVLLKEKQQESTPIFVLHEKGKSIMEVEFGPEAVFVLGDNIGLPKQKEKFALRFGEKISLGKQSYLALSCIDIINFLLDNYARTHFGISR